MGPKPPFFYRIIIIVVLLGVFFPQRFFAPEALAVQNSIVVGAGDIANSGSNDEATAKLIDAVVAQDPAATVLTFGDNAYPDGTASNFSNFYAPTWGRHRARTRPSPGNHDYHTSGASGYFDYFCNATAGCVFPSGNKDLYYSFNIGNWHLISLNSEISHTASSPQVAWLKQDLAANTKPCTLAYWHKPRFSSSSNHGSYSGAAPLWDALYAAGADIVLGGHDHLYERFAPQNPSGKADPAGIREFVVGTGGAGLYSFGTPIANSEVRYNGGHGILKLTLHDTSYDWEFISVAGKTFTDKGTGYCVTPGGSPSPSSVSDLNQDGRVDIIDLGIFLSNWGSTSKPKADVNQDGKVDIIDLGILLSNWG